MSIGMTRHLLAVLTGTLLLLLLYVIAAYAWSGYGGVAWSLWRLEIPVVLLLSFVFYAPRGRQFDAWACVMAFLPVLAFYVSYDIHHKVFARSLRLSDLREFVYLWELEPRVFVAVMALVASLLALAAWRHWRWLRQLPARRAAAVLLLKASALLLLAGVLQSAWLQGALLQSSSFYHFNDWKNIKHNGRIAGVLYYQARQGEAQALLSGASHPPVFDSLFLAPVKQRRNVHIIVLESFIDPRRFSGVEWDRSPLCPRLKPFLGPHDFSLVRSPVYGGFTAQAEFELLTGLPALRLVNGIEFNAFEGHPASTWVHKLQQQGYHTVATYATHSGFYNTRRAYPSLGFVQLHGLDNAPYFALPKGEKILADSLLYEANLAFLQRELMPRQPFVNYVLTMQGHYPYTLDPQREPLVVRPGAGQSVSQDLLNVANLFFHRSCALADFLIAVRTADPQSIVLAISDHLPPDLIGAGVGYPPGQFMNVALMLDRFEPVDLSQLNYYQIAQELWRRLSDAPSASLPALSAEQLRALYLSLHAEGITPPALRKKAGALPPP